MTYPTFKKLNKKEIISCLQDGAIIEKVYGVYSYYVMIYNDKKHYAFRQGSVASALNSITTEIFDRSNEGYKIKIK
jgi:hypothetical protein